MCQQCNGPVGASDCGRCSSCTMLQACTSRCTTQGGARFSTDRLCIHASTATHATGEMSMVKSVEKMIETSVDVYSDLN